MSKHCHLEKSILCFILVLGTHTFSAFPSLQAQEKSDSANKIGNNPSAAVTERMTLAPPIGNAAVALKPVDISPAEREKMQDDIKGEETLISDLERMAESDRLKASDGKLSKDEADRLNAIEKSIEEAKIRIFDKNVELDKLKSPEDQIQDKLRHAQESLAENESQLEQAKQRGDKNLIETFEKLVQSSKNDITESEALLKNPNWIPSYIAKELEENHKLAGDKKEGEHGGNSVGVALQDKIRNGEETYSNYVQQYEQALKGGDREKAEALYKSMESLGDELRGLIIKANDKNISSGDDDADAVLLKDAQNMDRNPKDEKDVDAMLLKDNPNLHANDQPREPVLEAEKILQEESKKINPALEEKHISDQKDVAEVLHQIDEEQRRESPNSDVQNEVHENQVVHEQNERQNSSSNNPNCPM